MSEKRKPDFVFLLKKEGKPTKKIELFDSEKWGEKFYLRNDAKKYRIRVKGKWFPEKKVQYFTKWQIRDLLWRSIKF